MTASLTQSLPFSPPRTAQVSDLVAVLAARDAAALAQVYDEHRVALCAFCTRLLGNRAAAEDLTHDVFLRLPELIHKLEPGRSLRAFLLGIAANRAQHYRRAAARRQKLAERFVQEPTATVPEPDHEAERRFIQSQIASALEHLPPEQQAAFVLAELEGQDAATIARQLSIPEATARTRLFHARRKLRVILSAWGLVAVFVATAAFAATQPAVRRAVVQQFQAWFGGVQPSSPRAMPTRPRAQLQPHLEPAPGVESAPGIEPPRIEPAPVALEALPLLPAAVSYQPSAVSSERKRGQTAAETAPARKAAPPASEDPALEGYRAAHRAHFDGGDPAAALLAWDRYLAEFPASSFATDARFNRAVCLIRLGQNVAAKSALTPFASAPPGSYRQSEAASLLEGLD